MREAFERFWSEARPLMVNEDVPATSLKPYRVHYAAQLKAGGILAWEQPPGLSQ